MPVRSGREDIILSHHVRRVMPFDLATNEKPNCFSTNVQHRSFARLKVECCVPQLRIGYFVFWLYSFSHCMSFSPPFRMNCARRISSKIARHDAHVAGGVICLLILHNYFEEGRNKKVFCFRSEANVDGVYCMVQYCCGVITHPIATNQVPPPNSTACRVSRMRVYLGENPTNICIVHRKVPTKNSNSKDAFPDAFVEQHFHEENSRAL